MHILNICEYLKCTNLNHIESQTYIFLKLCEDWNEIIQYFAYKWNLTNKITLLIAVGKLRMNVSFEIFNHIFHILLIIYRYYNLSNLHKIFIFIFSIINDKLIECFVKFSIYFIFICNSTRCNNSSGIKKKKKRSRIYGRNCIS